MNDTSHTEHELLLRVAGGEEPAFRILFDRYKNRVFGYAYAMTHSHDMAEEIAQEIFIKLWQRRDLLAQVQNADAYIFTMVRHRCIHFLQKTLADKKGLQQLADRMQYLSVSNEEQTIESEYRALLQRAVSGLSPQRKQVFQLSRGKGMSLEEIAIHLGLSRNTVKNHLVEALKQVKATLSEHGLGMLLLFLALLEENFLKRSSSWLVPTFLFPVLPL